ncbi:MAG: DUF3568 family protein [Deltaproteobacteria bacterium]|nr:DUF3568 family protein [Deltaproteobacteria bacterium]
MKAIRLIDNRRRVGRSCFENIVLSVFRVRAGVAHKCTPWIVLAALAGGAFGCAPAAILAGGVAGAAGVVWVKGSLEETLTVPLDRVHQAALDAIKAFELPVQKDRKDKMSAVLAARFADGKHLQVQLVSLAESSTKVSIRVGVFGDEARSRRLLKEIQRRLE